MSPRTGSPPRGRGRLSWSEWDAVGLGLTPAWAGTADHDANGAHQRGAHPRVGGDGCWRGESHLHG